MKRAAKFTFGLLAILMGAAILAWCAYCLFVPNPSFHWRLVDIPRLAVPLAMVWVGWNWLRSGTAKEQRNSAELTVTLKLSGGDFGTRSERDQIIALKHRLENRLTHERLGKIDGEEFGDSECCLFVQTDAPAETERLIGSFLASEVPSLIYSISIESLPDGSR